jgi:hypothetical protein
MMRSLPYTLGFVLLVSSTAQATLPNENLPGNSPSLPNSNLPGSMPTDNPVYLPNTDTSRAVIPFTPQPGFAPGANVPERNPTLPPSEAEVQAVSERDQLIQSLNAARQEAANANKEAEAARADAADARDQAAAARVQAAASEFRAAAAAAEAAKAAAALKSLTPQP